MLVFATQITAVVLRGIFSCELRLRNLGAVAAVIIPIFTVVLNPSRPQTEREVCSMPQCPLGDAVALLFAFGGARSFPWFQVVSLCCLSGCSQWDLKSLCCQCHVLLWQTAFAWLGTRPSGPLCWCNGRAVLLKWERWVWGRERPWPCTTCLTPQCSPELDQTLQPCLLSEMDTDSNSCLEFLS